MHLLILGHSSIVQRRVLPAARSVSAIAKVSVASRSYEGADYQDYEDALRTSGAHAVYVSGINTEHARWVTAALERDMHVMVDKPAFLDLQSAEAAVSLARRRHLGLAEATVFAFHPQVAAAAALLPAEMAGSTRITAVLSIPPRPAGDFRIRADAGGGSLNDLGPYAVATNRLFFGQSPEHVECRVLTRLGPAEAGRSSGVDTSFSVLLAHDHGGVMAGHFGFVTTYQNRFAALNATRTVDVERFFTTPPDAACALRVQEDGRDQSVVVQPADAFAAFLQSFTAAAASNRFDRFTGALLEDARLMERLRAAALRS